MKKRIRLKGRIATYIKLGLYLGGLLCAVDAAISVIDYRAGLIAGVYTIFYFIVMGSLYFYNKPIIMNELISFATEYGQIQRKILTEMELPYALLDDAGKVIWSNIAFETAVHHPKGYNKSITGIFPTLTKDKLPNEETEEVQYDLVLDENEYSAKLKRISRELVARSRSPSEAT